MTEEIWYRYEDVHYAPPLDEYENPCGEGTVEVHLREFKVLKRTPKGVWLVLNYNGYVTSDYRRFVLLDARKQYACPTKEKAIQSFIARKNRQISIYEHRVFRAKKALNIVKAELQK